MKKNIALVLALAVLAGGRCGAEDIAALRADMAEMRSVIFEQQQQLGDLRAKMATSRDNAKTTPQNITSMRKNAVVTIGGLANYRYYYNQTKVESSIATGRPNEAPNGTFAKREDYRLGDMRVHDAKLSFAIKVNENVDAYLMLDMHDGARRSNVNGVAQNYWVRWKNICNSGFGVTVGRDNLVFGDWDNPGFMSPYNLFPYGMGDFTNGSAYKSKAVSNYGDGMLVGNGIMPYTTIAEYRRTTQIVPYWENGDGTFKAEVALLQSADRITGGAFDLTRADDAYSKIRSINYGLGSMTARITWKPMDGLKFTASALNYHTRTNVNGKVAGPKGNALNNNMGGLYDYALDTASNNSAVNLAVQYRPAYFKRLNATLQWTHGWNEAWIRNMDSDVVSGALIFNLTDRMTLITRADYIRTVNDQSETWRKGTAWGVYAGLSYALPYGVMLEAGWRHEVAKFRNASGNMHTKATGDTIYGNLMFAF